MYHRHCTSTFAIYVTLDSTSKYVSCMRQEFSHCNMAHEHECGDTFFLILLLFRAFSKPWCLQSTARKFTRMILICTWWDFAHAINQSFLSFLSFTLLSWFYLSLRSLSSLIPLFSDHLSASFTQCQVGCCWLGLVFMKQGSGPSVLCLTSFSLCSCCREDFIFSGKGSRGSKWLPFADLCHVSIENSAHVQNCNHSSCLVSTLTLSYYFTVFLQLLNLNSRIGPGLKDTYIQSKLEKF